MPEYVTNIGTIRHRFKDLKALLGAASPLRSGDELAHVAAQSEEQRIAARLVLADLPLGAFLSDLVVPYESDEVTRLIIDTHDADAFAPLASKTVGEFREWLLDESTTGPMIRAATPGITPEMAAAVSKLMRNQELVVAARKIRVISAFRNTIGGEGTFSVRIQPNHPTDDPRGIAASTLDGLMLGAGDAVIGLNPASDHVEGTGDILRLLDNIRATLAIPTQTCVLAHVTTTMELVAAGAPVDLCFQSIAGTEAANRGFGIDLSLLDEAHEATISLSRGTVGQDCMYFETGQGSCLSSESHHGVDQQTLEARAYAVARRYKPLLVNSVVGFIGPEYLYNGKQIARAGLEDHFCGKLLGLPMGLDICYTNHAEADADDMDAALTMAAVAGCNFIMGVPGADDVMLGYQATSFHDALYVRETLGLTPSPEFQDWLEAQGIWAKGRVVDARDLALPAQMMALVDRDV
ncbi:MAG: ethanolamine ammonia-lyase subunit EutB [Pseudomonadota bacterium]